jgi:membrane associated rhomboid family serine protease
MQVTRQQAIDTIPIVTYLLIAINILVFVLLLGLGCRDEFIYALSTVPREIINGQDIVTAARTVYDPISGTPFHVPGLKPTPIPVYLTLLTSMFMHGGIAHLLGNMLFLWIFGDNIENSMGRARYLAFYLICGILASLSHVYSTIFFGGNSLIPSLGASGAISGVLAAYLLLHSDRKVCVSIINTFSEVPAVVAIGLWLVFQLISGLGSGSQQGGIAYAAHIGGLVAGLVLVKFFTLRDRQNYVEVKA